MQTHRAYNYGCDITGSDCTFIRVPNENSFKIERKNLRQPLLVLALSRYFSFLSKSFTINKINYFLVHYWPVLYGIIEDWSYREVLYMCCANTARRLLKEVLRNASKEQIIRCFKAHIRVDTLLHNISIALLIFKVFLSEKNLIINEGIEGLK